MKFKEWIEKNEQYIPWVAGAGFAVSHIVIASSCTVTKEGRCSSCGGCVIALAAIVTWAVRDKKKNGGYYEDEGKQSETNHQTKSNKQVENNDQGENTGQVLARKNSHADELVTTP